MPLKIVHFGDPILKKKGKPVLTFDERLVDLANEMVDTMYDAEGIGLAAQQVGMDLQFCVIDLREAEAGFSYEFDGTSPPLDLFMPLALANPEVEITPEPTSVYEEGCLSFPEIRGNVVRPDRICVKFQDLGGQPHELTCTGLLSRCVQHEVDHLKGVLFIERMDKETLAQLETPLRALKKKTRKSV
jgi:peptide deformylase